MLGRRRFQVQRYSGQYVNGRWVNNPIPLTFYIYASLQPISNQELESLPEGRRTTSNYHLISDTHLSSGVVGESNPDRVLIGDIIFEVIKCDRWQSGIISHHKMIISRAQQ